MSGLYLEHDFVKVENFSSEVSFQAKAEVKEFFYTEINQCMGNCNLMLLMRQSILNIKSTKLYSCISKIEKKIVPPIFRWILKGRKAKSGTLDCGNLT